MCVVCGVRRRRRHRHCMQPYGRVYVHCIIETAAFADISFVIAFCHSFTFIPFARTHTHTQWNRTHRAQNDGFSFHRMWRKTKQRKIKHSKENANAIKFSHRWKFYGENMNFMRVCICEQQINKSKMRQHKNVEHKKSWRNCWISLFRRISPTVAAWHRIGERY